MNTYNTAIEITNLSLKIGKKSLLENINWTVRPGEKWLVYGMNGCGKTTLLSCIAGVQRFDTGILKVFDETYSNINYPILKSKIGFISSSFFDKFYSKETVLDIVLSGKYGYLGLSELLTLEDIHLAKEYLKILDLQDKLYFNFSSLSKGERQNVIIARALMSSCELLLLDEPFNGLDIYHQVFVSKIIDYFSRFSDKTLIYVTHQLRNLPSFFNLCLLMKNGSILQEGPLKTTFSSKNLSQFYI
ncbi:MAG: ATP-binding cassette domain-containing protein [Peptococcaceae bacterium]|nr:ATP-binding cassette domain-containing protein [Peptococcaceae bacterium]